MFWQKHGHSAGRGRYYETRALKYLQRQGLKLVARNYHSRYGEIDLIVMDTTGGKNREPVLVFVEVRYRASSSHGLPVETIGYRKRQKIVSTARHYLQKHGLSSKMNCRFDVIGISGQDATRKIRWIRNAFQQ